MEVVQIVMRCRRDCPKQRCLQPPARKQLDARMANDISNNHVRDEKQRRNFVHRYQQRSEGHNCGLEYSLRRGKSVRRPWCWCA